MNVRVEPASKLLVVTYLLEAKITCLGVQRETIDTYNLTSEQVAREMAEDALRISRIWYYHNESAKSHSK